MPSTHSIPIKVEPPYTVTVAPGLLANCGEALTSIIGQCKVAVITESNVAPLYLATVTGSLQEAGFSVTSFIFPAGEIHKNLHTLEEILEFLAREELTRTDCVLALGGGVCGDMAGFAAGTYLRGIRCVQLPTTLLAAVDSSVGGKTGVNLQAGKNLAGLFFQPAAVLCDTACLKTLPREVFADGMAKVIKTGVLSGGELFQLSSQDCRSGDMGEIIARCVAHKGKVVEQDEFETGLRKTLNLGHTAGHAIEQCSNYTVSHGRAVAVGMVIISRAAEKLGWCEETTSAAIVRALAANGLPTTMGYTAAELAKAALADKKRSGGEITLVFPNALGDCRLQTIPVAGLEAVFRAGLEGWDGY